MESPKDWAVYRDATCKTISWKGETGQHRRLAPTPEPHVWSIEEMEKTSNGEKWFVIGNMGVYVDDLLLVAPDNILEETLKALEERFTLATPEWVTGEKTVTFCGYEISKTDQGYALGQEKYIRDLMDKHNIKQTAGVPCPKVEEGPEEPAENLQGPVLRAAQQLCGELMWLTTRTRPDVAYTVGGHVKAASQKAWLRGGSWTAMPEVPLRKCIKEAPVQGWWPNRCFGSDGGCKFWTTS